MSLTSTVQFKQGKDVEAWLDRYFGERGFKIEKLSMEEERVQHIGDRRFKKGKWSYLIEYKSGIQTYTTGNIFLETVSVDTTKTPGWVFTCKADWIVYACLLNHKLLWFKPDTLRIKITQMQQRYPTVFTGKGQNKNYKTHGVIVPLAIAEKELASHVTQLSTN